MSEEFIIEHCSPTLAGIKTGNLFSVKTNEETDINIEIRRLNDLLRANGLRVIPLKKTPKYTLVYVYRPVYLKRDLDNPKAAHILKKKGYNPDKPEYCIAQLVSKLNNCESFPHEIGLFLGYPPSDVECFMKNPHEGYICCGCWKVYSDSEGALRTFHRYKKCKEVYRELNKNGKSLAQLAVTTELSVTG